MKTLICVAREDEALRLRRFFPEGDVYVTTFSRHTAVRVDRILILTRSTWRFSEAESRAYKSWREWVPTRLTPEALAAGNRILEIER